MTERDNSGRMLWDRPFGSGALWNIGIDTLNAWEERREYKAPTMVAIVCIAQWK